MDDLKLYYSPSCPFCQKVMRYMDRNGIEIEMMPLSQGDNRQVLLTVGGKVQVPCLFIDGRPMYESDDIIAYLAQRLEAQANTD